MLRSVWTLLLTATLATSVAAPAVGGGSKQQPPPKGPPTCAQLATDPAYGLVGNAKLAAASSAIVAATATNAAYCNVQITYSAKSGPAHGYDVGQAQAIKIGVGLPLSSADGGTGSVQGAWNGKIQNLGGGGCVGNVGSTTNATNAGYVGSSTDTGHTSAENGQFCNFGVIQSKHTLNLGKINDFIYEGVHQQVEWAKTVAKTYYGRKHARNYWNGCSTGGRQGLALAQKYGDEFDGFIIGAPAIYWQAFRLADVWPQLVVRDKLTAIGKTLTAGQVSAANAAAIAACDVQSDDGVADGLISDPRQCGFSAKANICGKPGAPAAPDCVDADQAAAIDKIWDGPRNRFGKRIWFPFDRGINFGTGSFPNSTGQVMAYNHRDLTFSSSNLFLDKAAIGVAGNPASAITYEDEATLGSRDTGDYMETQDADLSKVRRSGGKIIMWHGTADPAIRWRHSADYYRRVATFFGDGRADFKRLQSWFRYFPAPGVAHCGGGIGPSPTAVLFDALVNWVEKGVAPDTLLATGGSLLPTRTRPLCPYPKAAIYDGSGSTDDAANFRCGGNLETRAVVCDSVRTRYKHENQNSLDFRSAGLDHNDCSRGADHDHDHDGHW